METTEQTPNTRAESGRFVHVSPSYMRRLHVPITFKEEVNLAHQVADLLGEVDDLVSREAKLAEEKREVAKAIEAKQTEARELMRAVKNQEIEGDVECKSYYDLDRLTIVVKRQDTFAIVDERPMTAEERETATQPELFKGPDKDTAEALLDEPRANSPEDLGYAAPPPKNGHGKKRKNGKR